MEAPLTVRWQTATLCAAQAKPVQQWHAGCQTPYLATRKGFVAVRVVCVLEQCTPTSSVTANDDFYTAAKQAHMVASGLEYVRELTGASVPFNVSIKRTEWQKCGTYVYEPSSTSLATWSYDCVGTNLVCGVLAGYGQNSTGNATCTKVNETLPAYNLQTVLEYNNQLATRCTSKIQPGSIDRCLYDPPLPCTAPYGIFNNPFAASQYCATFVGGVPDPIHENTTLGINASCCKCGGAPPPSEYSVCQQAITATQANPMNEVDKLSTYAIKIVDTMSNVAPPAPGPTADVATCTYSPASFKENIDAPQFADFNNCDNENNTCLVGYSQNEDVMYLIRASCSMCKSRPKYCCTIAKHQYCACPDFSTGNVASRFAICSRTKL